MSPQVANTRRPRAPAAEPIRPKPIVIAVHQALLGYARELAHIAALDGCCSGCRATAERLRANRHRP